MDLDSPPDFAEPDDFSDFQLVIEGNVIHAHKVILATASPVWRKLLIDPATGKFNNMSQIELDDKNHEDFIELLRCIYPSIRQHIYDKNIFQIIPLADEYEMDKLKEECEDLLLIKLYRHDSPATQYMHYLIIAQNFRMPRLLERAIKHASKLTFAELETQPNFNELTRETFFQILMTRIKHEEQAETANNNLVHSWIEKESSLQSELESSERNKDNVKKEMNRRSHIMLKKCQELSHVWDHKGPDCRCTDDVHMYGDFNFSCQECVQRLKWYIERKHKELFQIDIPSPTK